MRVAGGNRKGQRLKVSRKGIRPTKNIVREAIFNIIGNYIHDAKVLDIFAGSGALGIESLSRGAAHCVFIEKRPKILAENIEKMLFKDQTEIIKGDFKAGLMRIKKRSFNIIFLDPPYYEDYMEKALALISNHNLLQNSGLIIAEHSPKKNFVLPGGFSLFKEKQYGETAVTFIVNRGDAKGMV